MTAGIICAAGYSEIDNQPKVIAKLGDQPILKRAIDAHLAAGFAPVAVVVNPIHKEAVRTAVDYSRYDGNITWSLQPSRAGNADAVRWALSDLYPRPKRVIVSFGDSGLWSPDTLRALLDYHCAVTENDGGVMTIAIARVGYCPGIFQHYGIVLPEKDDATRLQMVKEYWRPTALNSNIMVSPGLFCFDANWAWAHLQKLPFRATRDPGLPAEQYISGLVQMAHQQGRPARAFCLDDSRAHEALAANTAEEMQVLESILFDIKFRQFSPTEKCEHTTQGAH